MINEFFNVREGAFRGDVWGKECVSIRTSADGPKGLRLNGVHAQQEKLQLRRRMVEFLHRHRINDFVERNARDLLHTEIPNTVNQRFLSDKILDSDHVMRVARIVKDAWHWKGSLIQSELCAYNLFCKVACILD